MLSTTAPVVVTHAGFGFFPFFLLIPLLWLVVLVLLVVLLVRGRRRWAVYGPWGGGWQQGRSAEATLAERFANGDIDEVEYRARLEVLRANRDQPR